MTDRTDSKRPAPSKPAEVFCSGCGKSFGVLPIPPSAAACARCVAQNDRAGLDAMEVLQ